MTIEKETLEARTQNHGNQITHLFKITEANTEVIEKLAEATEVALQKLGNDFADGLKALRKLLEQQIKDSFTRRRINRSISVKGIIQYEGTVEGHGLTHEEMMVEQARMDAEIDRLQPKYEEFVEPLP